MNITKTVIVLMISILFACAETLAQDHMCYIQSLNLMDGLSSTQITYTYQDKLGVMWIGTSDGLNRYDGTNVKSYTKEDGLVHNYIIYVAEDDLGACMR